MFFFFNLPGNFMILSSKSDFLILPFSLFVISITIYKSGAVIAGFGIASSLPWTPFPAASHLRCPGPFVREGCLLTSGVISALGECCLLPERRVLAPCLGFPGDFLAQLEATRLCKGCFRLFGFYPWVCLCVMVQKFGRFIR